MARAMHHVTGLHRGLAGLQNNSPTAKGGLWYGTCGGMCATWSVKELLPSGRVKHAEIFSTQLQLCDRREASWPKDRSFGVIVSYYPLLNVVLSGLHKRAPAIATTQFCLMVLSVREDTPGTKCSTDTTREERPQDMRMRGRPARRGGRAADVVGAAAKAESAATH